MSITITDTVSPLFVAAEHLALAPRVLLAPMGKQLEVDLRAHFAARDGQGNAKGWPRRHFYAEIRSSTALTRADDEAAVVTIGDYRFAQKLHGGTIRPKRGRALAIPLRAEAYAKGSPRERDDADQLFVIKRTGGHAFLALRRGGSLRLQYLLLPYVVQQADPDALPPREALTASVLQRGRTVLARHLQGRST